MMGNDVSNVVYIPKKRNVHPPTVQLFGSLLFTYKYFNQHLFGNSLPSCMITVDRSHKKAKGYFAPDWWQNNQGNETTDQITMNPTWFETQSTEEVLSTLVHEMVHLWQKHYGKPGRGRYHNKEWAQKMEEVGLMPSSTGKEGGDKTGDAMSHYIMEDGLFRKDCKQLLDNNFTLSWRDNCSHKVGNRNSSQSKRTGKRQKYTCPKCQNNVWAKFGIRILCGDCVTPYIATELLSHPQMHS